jgi:predicted dehydrogenase
VSAHATQEVIEAEPGWGDQHVTVLQNFAEAVLGETELLAPGAEGIRGVRLANAIHLSSWTGREVPLDFDEDEFLRGLNERIETEGRFPTRS